jgi:hypothetical protein
MPALAWLLVVASAALNGPALIVDNMKIVCHVTMGEAGVTHASLSRSCCNLHSALWTFVFLSTFCGIWLIRRP